jgi:hypothetical protein
MNFPLSDELEKYLKGFVFPQIPLDQWLIINKMQLLPLDCSNCGNKLNPHTPIASKLDRGVVFEQCTCGSLPPVSLVSACPKERQSDIEFFHLLAKELE